MSFTKRILFVSALIVVVSFTIHELYPQHISWFIEYPLVKSAANSVHLYLRSAKNLFETDVNNNGKEKSSNEARVEKLFTEEELKDYDGTTGKKGPYIALLGKVYNVKKGKQHYGEGGGYSFFAGRDASRAYVSGEFEEKGLIPDVSNLTSSDYLGLEGWEKFYRKDYKYVGKLIGIHYDENGNPTTYNKMVQGWIAEAHAEREADDKEKQIFPNCNSKWTPDSGTEVWCTSKSGGVERGWVGVPRKHFTPGRTGARCTCVRNTGPPSNAHGDSSNNNGDLDNPNIKEFENCPPDHTSCKIPVPENKKD